MQNSKFCENQGPPVPRTLKLPFKFRVIEPISHIPKFIRNRKSTCPTNAFPSEKHCKFLSKFEPIRGKTKSNISVKVLLVRTWSSSRYS